uniref:Uncharacterized protein n=1 Tax=Anguilla anguilla TaxID=7936 RepID=A0A0E9QR93_ANGAN
MVSRTVVLQSGMVPYTRHYSCIMECPLSLKFKSSNMCTVTRDFFYMITLKQKGIHCSHSPLVGQ